MDWSKGISLHRLYGHVPFCIEARKKKKAEGWIARICEDLDCRDGAVASKNQITTI